VSITYHDLGNINMKKMRMSVLVFIISLVLLSCDSEVDPIDDLLDELEINEYYSSEIFNDDFLNIYGKWELYDVTGGIHGEGHDRNFDILRIKKYGIYAFTKNNTTLEYGKIEIDKQTNDFLKITFVPHSGSEIFMYDSEKNIEFYGMDTLFISSPCCDRYNYHFIRKE